MKCINANVTLMLFIVIEILFIWLEWSRNDSVTVLEQKVTG